MTISDSLYGQDIPFIFPDWSGLTSSIRAVSTLRDGGVSQGVYGAASGGGLNLGDHVADDPVAVEYNRKKINRLLPSDVIFLSQVHGNIAVNSNNLRPGLEADAVVSSQPGKVCAVLTADCLPVLFSDVTGRVVAATHAGWRGLAAGILQNTVDQMRSQGAGEILAWLGPAIGPAQFEVGQDVFNAFVSVNENTANCFLEKRSSSQIKYLADIYGLARKLLTGAGVTKIFGGQYCTVSEPEKFYSYRRDGVTGRMASMIWIEPDQ